MKLRMWVISVAMATGVFATGALAQHEGHQPNQTAPPADKAGPHSMAGMMAEMQGQQEAVRLVDRSLASLDAIEAEKDPAALREKLAAHRALLKELQAKIEAQSSRMEKMHRMMGEKMHGGEAAKSFSAELCPGPNEGG
jgi:hypothetical protein